MIKISNFKRLTIVSVFFFGLLLSCNESQTDKHQVLHTNTDIALKENKVLKPSFKQSEDFKNYWYSGTAEITSYQLEQARYGELRDGHAVLVFVTEDFLPEKQVKADNYNKANTSILKLNATKTFNTGVYPYSIMQSTFYPVSNTEHAIKLSCSVQEWCGHVYSQLNNRDQFEITSHSYFEREADQDLKLDKAILENELWPQLRLDPKSLPVGDLEIIPSLEYVRLKHIELKAYPANAQLENGVYTITYPDLNRQIAIHFNAQFPFDISGWEETYKDGYGINAKTLTTKATKLKTIKSPYWSKNSNDDEVLRKELGLE
ncbi:septum formation inhibitor Maf [uncultured Psychroserpens sp.]|uniref:septum formation inhibitor Maf n=1 Tax=uncultured Psychroserpens sp. TaxID=255436 RepID=UPI00261A674C|nr:septum formation inhibitor Maf [uncultured Psychroserpens sp.]